MQHTLRVAAQSIAQYLTEPATPHDPYVIIVVGIAVVWLSIWTIARLRHH